MAVNYALPPWLAGPAAPNPASSFISNLHTGVTLGMEQQRLARSVQQMNAQIAMQERRLAQEQERENMAMVLKQQQMQQEMLMQQQRLEVTRAYQQEQADLKREALKQTKERIDTIAQTAARKFSAQQGYQKTMRDIDDAEQSGQLTSEQADDARQRTLMQFGPAMGAPLGSLQQLSRPRFKPTEMDVGGTKMIQASPQHWIRKNPPVAGMKASVDPLTGEVKYTGSADDPQMQSLIERENAKKAAKAAAKAQAPGNVFSRAWANFTHKTPATNAPAETPAPAAAPAAAPAPAAQPPVQFRWNPKTRSIEAVGGEASSSSQVQSDESVTQPELFDDSELDAVLASVRGDEFETDNQE